jgi:hypothetical protein
MQNVVSSQRPKLGLKILVIKAEKIAPVAASEVPHQAKAPA